jgi:hypothetical protein
MHNLGFHRDALRKLGGPGVPLRVPFVDPIPNETRENEKMRRAMSRAFTEVIEPEREYRYKRTVAITELLFDKAESIPTKPDGPAIPRAGGIVYPAMQMRGAADNVALWPEFVDRCMAVTLALYVLVEHADPQSSSYTLFTLAKADAFPDGNIDWRKPDGPEWKRRSQVTFCPRAVARISFSKGLCPSRGTRIKRQVLRYPHVSPCILFFDFCVGLRMRTLRATRSFFLALPTLVLGEGQQLRRASFS